MKKNTHTNNLFHLGFVEVISSPCKGVIGGVFPANLLASIDKFLSLTNGVKALKEMCLFNRKS